MKHPFKEGDFRPEKTSRRRALALFGACALSGVASVVLSGCGGSPAATPSGSSSGSGGGSVATTGTGGSGAATTAAMGEQITVGYSDWPSWVAWDIAEQKGFFKKHNVNVKLVWFPVYTDSLNAFTAGKVDINGQTWSDSLAPLSKGVPLQAFLAQDNSYGNDAFIAQPGFNSIKELKGKRVASELGTCDHMLLVKALELNGMTEKDIQFVNLPIQDCPNAMIAKRIDAAVVWEPSRTKVLNNVKGSRELFSSKTTPGLLPDLAVARKDFIDAHPKEIQGFVNAWYDTVDWWRTHPKEAVEILAKRTGTPPSEYQGFVKGTRVFSASESLAALSNTPKITTLTTSGGPISEFLIKAGQLDKMPDYKSAVRPEFTRAAIKAGLGKLPPYDYDKNSPS